MFWSPPSRSITQAASPDGLARRVGYTLIEILITIAVLGILAAVVIPQIGSSAPDQVLGVAQILASDLDYARTLAISNGSKYKLTFDLAHNAYVLTHSSSNSALDVLPAQPFRKPSADPQSLTISPDDFPRLGTRIKIVAVVTDETSPKDVDSIEFGTLGQTTRTQPTLIWLSSSAGAEEIYLPIRVHPITGLTEIGDFTSTAP
ncbi:prepilin-type N-terminal cleavage/methylation domain-containing protein [Bremerella cremea]|uniref:Prepilin-type N-terminal cleavage/methylation domain-containing protein n=1 Tax=Bremerella cremea TaxID=1031537 RepID=A0A368KP81_9BACT|nr:prepilin-type N-terminal cleavage/methylation domain-containing protein [Bremerella cremea]RCS42092.1 prepilin-type N-terminal cleavage/methylation domain-containing protein [Bremerella cremea]